MDGHHALLAFSWTWIVLGVVLGFGALVFVLFPVGIFAAAPFERVHLRHLRPAEKAKAAKVGGHTTVAEAAASGYTPLGVFSDGDRGMREGIVTLMLSPDRRGLLWVLHGKLAGRYRLITRSADGHWLVTSSVTGVVDLSGLQHEKMLANPSLPVMDEYHGERVANWPHPVVPWDPASVAADVLGYERTRVDRLVEKGIARYSEPGQVYRYTWRGAARITWGYLSDMFTMVGDHQFAAERKMAYENRRQYQGVVSLPDGSLRVGPPDAPLPPPDPLAPLARFPDRRPEFIRLLARHGVYVVTRPHEPDPESGDRIEHDVDHIDYVENGVSVFLVFSSEDGAAKYIQNHSPEEAYTPYYFLGVKADWLLGPELERYKLVMNPGSDAETVITASDLAALRAAMGAGLGPAAT